MPENGGEALGPNGTDEWIISLVGHSKTDGHARDFAELVNVKWPVKTIIARSGSRAYFASGR